MYGKEQKRSYRLYGMRLDVSVINSLYAYIYEEHGNIKRLNIHHFMNHNRRVLEGMTADNFKDCNHRDQYDTRYCSLTWQGRKAYHKALMEGASKSTDAYITIKAKGIYKYLLVDLIKCMERIFDFQSSSDQDRQCVARFRLREKFDSKINGNSGGCYHRNIRYDTKSLGKNTTFRRVYNELCEWILKDFIVYVDETNKKHQTILSQLLECILDINEGYDVLQYYSQHLVGDKTHRDTLSSYNDHAKQQLGSGEYRVMMTRGLLYDSNINYDSLEYQCTRYIEDYIANGDKVWEQKRIDERNDIIKTFKGKMKTLMDEDAASNGLSKGFEKHVDPDGRVHWTLKVKGKHGEPTLIIPVGEKIEPLKLDLDDEFELDFDREDTPIEDEARKIKKGIELIKEAVIEHDKEENVLNGKIEELKDDIRVFDEKHLFKRKKPVTAIEDLDLIEVHVDENGDVIIPVVSIGATLDYGGKVLSKSV